MKRESGAFPVSGGRFCSWRGLTADSMKSSFVTGIRISRTAVSFVALSAFVGVHAQVPPAPAQLAPFVTTATRTAAEPQTLGSVVDVISAAELARRQVNSLAGALGS